MAAKTVARKAPPRAELVKVSPDVARRWLGKNTHNRHVRAKHVQRLARDMATGNWLVTGESIKFNGDGSLLDGQHRLLAVIESEATVDMFVIRGLPSAAQDVMDTGAKRQCSDALHLNGFSHSSLLAAGIRLAINWQGGYFNHAHQGGIEPVTNSEVLAFAEANPDIVILAANAGSDWCKKIPAKPAVVLFTAWATARINDEQSQRFYTDLAEYHTAGPGDPKAALLRRLTTIARTRELVRAPAQADLFFRAWNAVRAKKPITKFTPRVGASNNFTNPK